MDFIKKWSFGLARFFASVRSENHQQRALYYFALQVLIGTIVKGVLMVAVSLILGIFWPTMIFLAVFASVRIVAGGYHMDTYGKCIGTALVTFIALCLVAKYTYMYLNVQYLILIAITIFAYTYTIIYLYAPSDTPNKPITNKEEIKKFRRLSFMHITLLAVICSVLIYIFGESARLYVLSGLFGMGFEVFSITPLGYKVFDRISGKAVA